MPKDCFKEREIEELLNIVQNPSFLLTDQEIFEFQARLAEFKQRIGKVDLKLIEVQTHLVRRILSRSNIFEERRKQGV